MFVWLWGKHENWNNKACKNLFLNNEAKEISISSELLFWKEKIREAGRSKYIWTVSKVTCDGCHEKHLHKELCFSDWVKISAIAEIAGFIRLYIHTCCRYQHILTSVAGFITCWGVSMYLERPMDVIHVSSAIKAFLVTGGWVCKILVALWGWM